MSESLNIHDELDSYRRLSGKAKAIVGRRLLKAAVEMDKQIKSLEEWLLKGDLILASEYDPGREDTWIAKLHRCERLYDMRDAIRSEVLDGD